MTRKLEPHEKICQNPRHKKEAEEEIWNSVDGVALQLLAQSVSFHGLTYGNDEATAKARETQSKAAYASAESFLAEKKRRGKSVKK